MYQQIKELAEQALKRQNKIFMEETLREIASIACQESGKTMFEDARIAKNGAEPCPEYLKPRAKCAPDDTGTAIAMSKQPTIGDAMLARAKKGFSK